MEERRKAEVALAEKTNGKVDVEAAASAVDESRSYEQERRDVEMAYRLASEANATVDELSNGGMVLKRSNYAVAASKNKKHDLSGWKYSDLRDTINTSCDVELLNACRSAECSLDGHFDYFAKLATFLRREFWQSWQSFAESFANFGKVLRREFWQSWQSFAESFAIFGRVLRREFWQSLQSFGRELS
jgi:hypothetical protein